MDFKLTSAYSPTGDQPTAIRQLVEGIAKEEQAQTLLGVTGSGKTFTIANVIQQINRPSIDSCIHFMVIHQITGHNVFLFDTPFQ